MVRTQKPQCVFSGADRVLAVGDLHGNFPGLRRILEETGLIDARGRWKARRTHLVLMGDVLGRGGEPGKIFALLRKLEAEAPDFRSRVHLLLGNHEAMTLRGVLRYSTLEEFGDLAEVFPEAGGAGPEASAPDAKLERRLDMLGARRFRDALAPGGAVGAWLLEHASAVAIDGHLFVHGGLNRAHGRIPLEELNARVRAQLAGARGGDDPDGPPGDPDPRPRRDGPQWHREYALSPGPERGEELDEVLAYHGCRRMVVGHTPTSCIDPARKGRILPLYDGKLYCIDTGIGRAYGGHLSALDLAGRAPEPLYFR